MSKTLAEAIEEVKAGVRAGGIDCPCCGQNVQVRKRNISKAMAEGLKTFERFAGRTWAHAPSVEGLSRLGGDWSRLTHWGLLEEAVGKREDGVRSGSYRITEDGRRFLRGELAVVKSLYTFNGNVRLIMDSGWVKITDLGYFDLRETVDLDPLDL